jgi:hypothetical protein
MYPPNKVLDHGTPAASGAHGHAQIDGVAVTVPRARR